MARLIAERRDVVAVLGEVFRRHGFEGASIARISQASGLGKGSLYHFFPGGKDEMAAAVLADIRDWFEAEIFRPLEQDEPAVAICTMFASVETYFQSGRRICLLGAFALEETRDRFAAALRGYFADWLAALAGALRRGGVDDAAATPLARSTVAGIQGAIVLTRAFDDARLFRESAEALRNRLLDALPQGKAEA